MPDGEPTLLVPVSDALARIEATVNSIQAQLVAKADTVLVHEIESRLRVSETQLATIAAVADAAAKARARIWVAIGVTAGGLAAVATWAGVIWTHVH